MSKRVNVCTNNILYVQFNATLCYWQLTGAIIIASRTTTDTLCSIHYILNYPTNLI